MGKIIPTLSQWQKWSLPSKASVIAIPLAIILATIPLYLTYCSKKQLEEPIEEENVILTILEFGSDTYIDHFYLDFLLRNDAY